MEGEEKRKGLYREIKHLLRRPVGRSSYKPKVFYHRFRYQAKSWDHARRVVAKVEWHMGELFPRIGFIVTNLNWRAPRVIRFYNHRGTAEQWIKEGKQAIRWTRLSCHDFRDNEVRLQLFALAYNLGNFLRCLALPRKIGRWSFAANLLMPSAAVRGAFQKRAWTPSACDPLQIYTVAMYLGVGYDSLITQMFVSLEAAGRVMKTV